MNTECLSPQPSPRLRRPSPRRGLLSPLAVDERFSSLPLWGTHGKPGQVGTACGGYFYSLPLWGRGTTKWWMRKKPMNTECLSPQPSPRLRRPSPRRGLLSPLTMDDVKSKLHKSLTQKRIICRYRKIPTFPLLRETSASR